MEKQQIHAFIMEYFSGVVEMHKKYPELRIGQVLYNVLSDYKNDFVMGLNSTVSDPYYAEDIGDERIDKFFDFLVIKLTE